MSYISSSGGTCYEKRSLFTKTHVGSRFFVFKFCAEFQIRNQETQDRIEYVYNGFKG